MLLQASSKNKLLIEQMALIRAIEDALQDLCNQGLGADLHFSKGQEAIAVGVCAALRDTDYTVTHHRTIAHAVAKGVPLRPLIAELLGKAEGINGGMAGEMYMSYPAKRFMFSHQLVATCVPVAAGLAWAVKHYLKSNDIVVVFCGDAATANGQFHEGMNIAAVQRLPLLVVCENNHLAGNVTPEHYQPTSYVSNRAVGYDVQTAVVNGNKVDSVLDAAKYAVNYVRATSRPFFLECETTRLGRHKQGQGDLRSKEAIAELALRDPLRDVDTAIMDAAVRDTQRVIAVALKGSDPELREKERAENGS